MTLSGQAVLAALALGDVAVAGWLLRSAGRARRNRESVVTVAAVLLGCGGWLAVLAVT